MTRRCGADVRSYPGHAFDMKTLAATMSAMEPQLSALTETRPARWPDIS